MKMTVQFACERDRKNTATVVLELLKEQALAVGLGLTAASALVAPGCTLKAAEAHLAQDGEPASATPAHLALVAPYLGPPVDLFSSKVFTDSGSELDADVASRILVDGFTDAGEPTCAEFHPTQEALATWLIHIRIVPEQFLVNELYSPCKLTGRIIVGTDTRANFSVQSSGVGAIELFGKQTVVFAPPGWTDPNAGLYFNSGE